MQCRAVHYDPNLNYQCCSVKSFRAMGFESEHLKEISLKKLIKKAEVRLMQLKLKPHFKYFNVVKRITTLLGQNKNQ